MKLITHRKALVNALNAIVDRYEQINADWKNYGEMRSFCDIEDELRAAEELLVELGERR